MKISRLHLTAFCALVIVISIISSTALAGIDEWKRNYIKNLCDKKEFRLCVARQLGNDSLHRISKCRSFFKDDKVSSFPTCLKKK